MSDGNGELGDHLLALLDQYDTDRNELIAALRLIYNWDVFSAEARTLERVDSIIEEVLSKIGVSL